MRIEKQIALAMADASLYHPFRQIKLMETDDFARWLQAREIALHDPTLYALWESGIIRPIALTPAHGGATPLDVARFVSVNPPPACEPTYYVDLGSDVASVPELTRDYWLSSERCHTLLWHPFQLWEFCELIRLFELRFGPEMMLSGSVVYARKAEESVASLPQRLAGFAQDSKREDFTKLLAVLIEAEPLVHTLIFGTRRDASEYSGWLREKQGTDLLTPVGLSVEDARRWHQTIAVDAQIDDPLEHFRVLVQHGSRYYRDQLKGLALRAHDLYDAAEVLRRYVERHLSQEFWEEDDARHGPSGAEIKLRLWGSCRPGDFDRYSFRKLVRDFGFDPQLRTMWFVEGASDEAFVVAFGDAAGYNLSTHGIEVFDVEGVGGISSTKVRSLLHLLSKQEVFAYASLDRDGKGSHAAALRGLANSGLLPAGYTLWKDDFEAATFDLKELATVATQLARATQIAAKLEPTIVITADEIRSVMRERAEPAGKALEHIARRNQTFEAKGKVWGEALARWALDHPERERPIVTRLLRMVSDQIADYRATLEHCYVDANGEVIAKPRP